MNYQKIHDSIINKALTRGKPDCYCEKHHILPKSMGGSDSKENLVLLTAREHYLIHWVLYKIYRNQEMAFAWHNMTRTKSSTERYTSYSFTFAKIARAKAMSERMLGKQLSLEHKANLKKAKLGKTYNEQGRLNSPLKGASLSEEHKNKIGAASKGRKHTQQTREKLRALRQGENNPMYGKPVSVSTRKKLSDALIGKKNSLGFKHSDEVREKQSKARMGHVFSEETKLKISLSLKKHYQAKVKELSQ